MDVQYRGRAAYLPAADALVIADIHIGRLAASNVEAPVEAHEGLIERLRGHLAVFEPGTVVVAGDVLHVHGRVPTGTSSVLEALVNAIRERDARPVLVRGNHDTLLDELDFGSTGTNVVDEQRLNDGSVVCHGHAEPDGDAPRYIVGHEHPAIRVEGARHPCFLVGKTAYRGGDVLVLPAFSQSASGTLVNGLQEPMSPLVADLGGFRPVIVGEQVYEFPPLAEFSKLL